MKKKIDKKYTAEKAPCKRTVCLEEFNNHRTNKKDFITNNMMDRLAEEYKNYYDGNDEALLISDWLICKGFNEKTWNTWCRKYEVLGEAHDHVLMILANRREKGLMHRKFEVSSTTFMMPMYSKDWRQREKERAEDKKNEDKGPGNVTVVMESYGPTTPKASQGKQEGERVTYNTYPVTHLHHGSNMPQVVYVAKTLEEYEAIRERYEIPNCVIVVMFLIVGCMLWKFLFSRPL